MGPNFTADSLKALRQQMGLTQRQMASALQVNQGSISRWEAGIQPIAGPVQVALRAFAATWTPQAHASRVPQAARKAKRSSK